MFDFLRNISPTELIIVAVILIIFFGSRAITSLAKTSGKTVKEIKNIKREFMETLKDDDSKPSK